MAIYLNNAATSYPKPISVAKAVSDFMTGGGANFSRGSASDRDLRTMDIVLTCRERVAKFFGAENSACVTFAPNVTEALNIVLKGYVRPGMRVLTSSMEHNSVMRPLRSLEKSGVAVEVLCCDAEGYLSVDTLREALAEKADLFVFSHASNVCGSLQDLAVAAELCADAKVPLVLDSAQTAGLIDIDVESLQIAALCFTGHKSLLGPQGTGGIIWNGEFASRCKPLTEGGTGSFSHEETQPEVMPDKFESGTLNLPGIAGLLAGVEYLAKRGTRLVYEEEMKLDRSLREGLSGIGSLTVYGDGARARVPVLAVNHSRIDNATIAHILSTEFEVETRPGIHCSPIAHRTLGTFPGGALRFSPGLFNTPEEIEYAVEAMKKIAARG